MSLQKNRLRSAKNVMCSLLCILVDRPMGGFEPPNPPLRTPLRGGLEPPIGLQSMQNRTFLVLLRPSFGEKMKTAPQRKLGAKVVTEL